MARVLFIEDDPSWQDTMGKLLEIAGHTYQRATTFDAAIGCLTGKQPFDVVVFDLRLGEKPPSSDIFVYLEALITGMTTRKLKLPPIVIVTGVDVSKSQVVRAFTHYRGKVYNFFEKRDVNYNDLLDSIKSAADYSPNSRQGSRSFVQLLAYTLLMTMIVLSIFAALLWSVDKIADPKTQQTVLQVGGGLVVVVGVFITVFSQGTKLEGVIESISKIWRA